MRRNTDTPIIHSTYGTHAMNTMTNTADFANRTGADAAANTFLRKLATKAFSLLCMISALNSVEKALLAEHIVLE